MKRTRKFQKANTNVLLTRMCSVENLNLTTVMGPNREKIIKRGTVA